MVTARFTVVWNGFSGAPGYSNFHFDAATISDTLITNTNNALKTLLTPVAANMPLNSNISFPSSIDLFETDSGELEGSLNATAPTALGASGAAAFSGASGAVVSWKTNTIVRGRRARGRTFLVPLATGAYDSAGTLASAVQGSLQSAVNTFLAASNILPFVIWARPIDGAGGVNAPVTSATVPDLAAILRSRRD